MFSKRMDHKTLKLQDLEHHVHRQLKPCLKGRGFLLLAVSGGLDSMALLSILARLRPLMAVPLHIVHIHHGPADKPEQQKFRDKALDFVKQSATELGLDFHTSQSDKSLASESELRDFRYEKMTELMTQLEEQTGRAGLLVTAHHWDDQVETRLLRLIRGTGATGFKAMSLQSGLVMRPLLESSREELEQYVQKLDVPFVSDPSNAEANAMRNWLRNEWLPQLEQKQPGSVRRMALSMEKLSDELSGKSVELVVTEGRIPRADFQVLAPQQKTKLLVRYLRQCGLRDYRASQVNELVKRLDTSRREHRFHLLKFEWRLNAEHIWINID